ncbi:hypothetical protein ACHAWF_001222 [Thalassiosira exigua]
MVAWVMSRDTVPPGDAERVHALVGSTRRRRCAATAASALSRHRTICGSSGGGRRSRSGLYDDGGDGFGSGSSSGRAGGSTFVCAETDQNSAKRRPTPSYVEWEGESGARGRLGGLGARRHRRDFSSVLEASKDRLSLLRLPNQWCRSQIIRMLRGGTV